MKYRVVLAILIALAIPGLMTVSANSWVMVGETTLLAGQHIPIGNARVYVDGARENLRVVYDTRGSGWVMTATHLWVGEGAPDKAAPGRFPYKGTHRPPTAYVEYVVPIPSLTNGTVCIAAHADVLRLGPGCWRETAWAEGDEFSKNWAMKFCVSLGVPSTF